MSKKSSEGSKMNLKIHEKPEELMIKTTFLSLAPLKQKVKKN